MNGKEKSEDPAAQAVVASASSKVKPKVKQEVTPPVLKSALKNK